MLELREMIDKAVADRNSTVTIQKWAAEAILSVISTPSAQADRAEAQDAAVGGLLERLEATESDYTGTYFRNPDGPEAASVIRSLQAERDALRLAILGGEDVPGVAATVSIDQCIRFLSDERMVSIDRAERAEAERDALRKALEPFARYYDLNDCDDRADDDTLEIPIHDLRRAARAMQGEGP